MFSEHNQQQLLLNQPLNSKFQLIFECSCSTTKFGEVVHLVGNTPELGQWRLEQAVLLSTSKACFPRWRSDVIRFDNTGDAAAPVVPAAPAAVQKYETVEFKFVIAKSDGSAPLRWEKIVNRQIKVSDVPESDDVVVICTEFDNAKMKMSSESQSASIPVPIGGFHLAADANERRDKEGEDEISRKWRGREIRFVKSKSQLKALEESHSQTNREPNERTVSSGNEAIKALLKGARESNTYLHNLNLVNSQIERVAAVLGISVSPQKDEGEKGSAAGTAGAALGEKVHGINSGADVVQLLAAVFVYLTFISEGQIPCVEDGGHNRPSQHAALSRNIFSILMRIVEVMNSRTNMVRSGHSDAAVILIRRILPLLPSFAESFTWSVPLTRIRDIAHRDDVPQDLKAEIKHTIQNKLHRCAGPEDLVATHRMLRRLLEQRQCYSEGFINEFTKFYEELKDFFSCRSLNDRLISIRQFHGSSDFNAALEKFLQESSNAAQGASLESMLAILLTTVELRKGCAVFKQQLTESRLQEAWLADIAVEQYVFGVVSQLTSSVAKESLEWGALKLTDKRWLFGMKTLGCIIRHVGFNGFHMDECVAIENLLEFICQFCWDNAEGFESKAHLRMAFGYSTYETKLLVQSSLDRAIRLTRSYTETILELYPPVVKDLGKASGVSSHKITVFAEGDVRANLVFQASRLASSLFNQISAALGKTGVDVIVEPTHSSSKQPPPLTGCLLNLPDMWRLPSAVASLGPHRVKVIARLQHATGDEEIAGLKSKFGVQAVILMHSIPHLSHLAIRARQEKLPFVAVVNMESEFAQQSNNLIGKNVELMFNADGVKLDPSTETTSWPDLRSSIRKSLDLTGNSSSESKGFLPERSDHSTITYMITGAATSAALAKVHQERIPPNASLPLLTPADPIDQLAERVGAKAASCGKLMKLGKESKGLFSAPSCWVLPFGSMESVLQQQGLYEAYCNALKAIDKSSVVDSDEIELSADIKILEDVLRKLQPSPSSLQLLMKEIETFAKTRDEKNFDLVPFIARSSANVEDLAGISAAGLYESFANINPSRNLQQFTTAIAGVWASLHSRCAILSRRAARISQDLARMAVLVQDLVDPYLSFVAHTYCPISSCSIAQAIKQNTQCSSYKTSDIISSSQSDWIYIEMALGLGETLASGSLQGLPFRFLIHKQTGEFLCLSFASFSISYKPKNETRKCVAITTATTVAPAAASAGDDKNVSRDEADDGDGQTDEPPAIPHSTEFITALIPDYTKDLFTLSGSLRLSVVRKLLSACLELEKVFCGYQDIEGAVVLHPSILESLDSFCNSSSGDASKSSLSERVQSIASIKIPYSAVDVFIVQSRPQPT